MIALYITGYLALCIVALFGMKTLRGKRGALWLWLPVMLVPPVVAASLLGVVPAGSGSGPDSGAVAMASGFYLMIVLPMLAPLGLLWLCGCFLFPRGAGWNLADGIGGSVLAAGLIGGWWISQHPPLEAIVVDEHGRPIADQQVTFHTFDFGSSHMAGSAVTGPDGRARARIPRSNERWARTVSVDGVACTTGTERLGNTNPDEPARLAVTQSWFSSNWARPSRIKFVVPAAQAGPLQLRLRSAKTLIDPELVTMIRAECAAQLRRERDGQFHLSDFDQGPEFYAVMEDLLAVYQAGVLETHSAKSALDQITDALGRASNTLDEVSHHPSSEAKARFRLLRHWVDPDGRITDDRAATALIAERLQSIADRVVEIALPGWPGKSDFTFVCLDRLAHPHLPRLLAKLEQMREFDAYRCMDTMLRCNPPVEQVRPFFHSANHRVALVAILGARRNPALSPAELRSLLEPYRDARDLEPSLQQEIKGTLTALPNRW